jgi:predicted dehydrogenase
MDTVRIAVIGLRFGSLHVQTLANMPEARLIAAADRSLDSASDREAYTARYGARAYLDGIEMLEQEKPDAVCLATSPRWRDNLVEYAASHGIAMFVEKPWGATLEQARRLAAICQRHNATVMTGFSFRFLPAVTRLQALMRGELGQGRMLNGEYIFEWIPPADHWLWDPANGGGFFNENSCHLFDVVCALLGRPVSVMAEGANFSGSPSEEAAAVTLRFASGAVAALTIGGIGTRAFRAFPRLDMVTENGQAHLDGREHIWETLTWATRDSAETHTLTTAPEWVGNTRYSAAFRHFFECIRTGVKPAATIADGVLAVALAEAIYESAHTGRKVSLDAIDPTESEVQP